MNETRKLITKRDSFILAVLLVLAVASVLFFKLGLKDGKTAVISVDGREYMRVALDSQDRDITLNNGVSIILRDGKIGFSESDCPDKVCIRTGMLSDIGEVAACVPNKTVIEIVGGNSGDIDVVTY